MERKVCRRNNRWSVFGSPEPEVLIDKRQKGADDYADNPHPKSEPVQGGIVRRTDAQRHLLNR